MTKEDYQDRRKYPRFTKHFILIYFDIAHPEDRYSASQLKNISLGGMCLITAKPFLNDTVLGIELKTPYFADLTCLKASVVGSTERIKNVIYETHVKFENLSEQANFILNKIIEHFKNESPHSYE